MILVRTLNREVATVTLTACVVLLLVSLASQFRVYIEAVASGALELRSIMPIMLNLVPQFLGLIVPIAFYIGLIVSLSRWQKQNELISLHACGVSQLRFCRLLLPVVMGLTLICGALQLYFIPKGINRATLITAENNVLNGFDLLTPKQFTPLAQNMQIYVEDIKQDKEIRNIFIYALSEGLAFTLLSPSADFNYQGQSRFFHLNQGSAYSIDSNTRETMRTTFSSAEVDITPEIPRISINKLDGLPTSVLLSSTNPAHQRLLWWRISLILIVPILFFGAAITQQVNPRRDVSYRLLEVFVFCVGYLGFIYTARSISADGAPAPLVFGIAHLGALAISYAWYYRFKT